MTPSVRIQTLSYPDLHAERLAPDHPWRRIAELRQILRRHLPTTTASLFARPEPAADGSGAVTWTCDLAGQPTPLLDLPEPEQAEARRVLDDQLSAIARLAEELERREPDDPAPARLLSQAIRYPGEMAVYVVDRAPVLISWAGTDPGQPPAAVTASGSATRPRRPWLGWALATLGLIALMGLGLLAWDWQQQDAERRLHQDLAAALAAECDPVGPLLELSSRLERIDPAGERYPDVRMAVLTEIGICEEADLFSERLEQRLTCAHLSLVAEELAAYDQEREPFRRLQGELDRRLADCARVTGWATRLAALAGDCAALATLQEEVAALTQPGANRAALSSEMARTASDLAIPAELAELMLDLEQAGAACRLAETLGPRLSAVLNDCPALRALARETAPAFADLDTDRPPLRELQEGLQEALARCDLAEHLEATLASSQGDCLALAGLAATLRRHDPGRDPLATLAERLGIALDQCAALSELEQRFAQAQGDCERLRDLAGRLDRYRTNLRFIEIRTRLAPELEVCLEADALTERIAALGGDCAKTRALAATLADRGDPRFAQARAALAAPLADCERSERYARRLSEAGTDCTRLARLERDLARESSPSLRPTRQRVSELMAPCRPPPPRPVVAQAPAKRAEPRDRPDTKTDPIRTIPHQEGSFPMRGECSGRLTIDPTSGWDGDRVRHIVTIDPPTSARVARVTSTNPGCRNCALRKIGPDTWRGDLYYGCPGRGIVPVSYAAYDAQGRVICSGNGSDLCLGRRR